MKYFIFLKQWSVGIVIVILSFGVFPKFVYAANSSTLSYSNNCSITYYYADSNGVYIGNSKTLAPDKPFQIKARWKKGTCLTVGSIQVGYLYTKNNTTMQSYQYCFATRSFSTEGDYTIVYANFGTAGKEGSQLRNWAWVGDSTSNCSSWPLNDRPYVKINSYMEIATAAKSASAATPSTSSSASNTAPTQSTSTTQDNAPITNPDTDVQVSIGQSFDTVIGTIYNPLTFDRPEQLVVQLINILLMLVGILSVIMILFGGFLLASSRGSESQIKKGRQTIIWAVSGLVVSLMAFSIVAIIQSIIS